MERYRDWVPVSAVDGRRDLSLGALFIVGVPKNSLKGNWKLFLPSFLPSSLFPRLFLFLSRSTKTDLAWRSFALSSQTNEKKLKVLQIALEDSVDADLLSILHETTTFFSNAKEEDEKILVFCNAGMSRSVAVALAYIVWKKAKKIDGKKKENGSVEDTTNEDSIDGSVLVERALRDVREKYPQASPNEGFLEQLELWCNMGCRLVATDETYKLFKHSQLERIRRERGCVDRGAVDEDPEKEMSNGATGSISQYYSCRKCRRVLATSKNVLEHEAGTGIDAFSWRQRRRGNDSGATGASSSSCSSIFVSPITWMMLDQTEENEPVIFQKNSGKIHCPKCRSKIGAFTWSGERCNCGAFVAPSFHIQKAKLDAFSVRANM